MIPPTATTASLLSSHSLALSVSFITDPIRDGLDAKVRHFSHLVGWSTITVAIGVLLEGVELVHVFNEWRKRKRRKKIERVQLKELRQVVPIGVPRRLSRSHSEEPPWVKLVLRIGLILVVIGVVGEWRCGARLEDAHDAVHVYDLEKLREANDKAGNAATSATEAETASAKAKKDSAAAVSSASNALTIASGARKEADTFEKDIVSAKQLAADAESHLADALQRAANAEEELYRLTAPRSIVNTASVVAALQQFRGTEYTLNVFMDGESLDFVLAVAKVLDEAGWTRKQPTVLRLGIPDMLISFDKVEEHVPACVDTGISLRAPTRQSLTMLQTTPRQLLSKPLQAALALQSAIAANISPPNKKNVVEGIIDPHPVPDGPLIVCVGKKP
jgi:hypothetical protein